MNSDQFKKQYAVSPEQQKDNDSEKFFKVYSELLEYLKTINFNKCFQAQKANIKNYKTLNSKNEPSESALSDETVYNIISYINFLSAPKYEKYWDKITIQKRSPEPDYSGLSETDKLNAQARYKEKLQQVETDIRLKTYINALYQKLQIYQDHNIREYFINLCATILLYYSKSHPKEITKMHFRFKSQKGLAIKLAERIIIKGHFEGNLKDGIDEFKYTDISDAFGAKIVSEKGFYPHASSDPTIQELIAQRQKRISELVNYEIFEEKIKAVKSSYNPTTTITYGEYYNKCLEVLNSYRSIINPKEKKVLELINNQIEYFNKQIEDNKIDDPSEFSILNEAIQIEDFKIFDDPSTSFTDFLTVYQNRIPSDLYMAGLKKGLNNILHNSGTTADDILLRNILSEFGVTAFNPEPKNTESGHEGIHYDIETPYGKFELQAQANSQYEFDKRSPTAAHSLMNGKGVTLYAIPKPHDISTITNLDDFEQIQTDDGSIRYYSKKELNRYKKMVEIITAKKGKIIYNEGMDCAQVDLYSSPYNYKAIAMELPKGHPKIHDINIFFDKLQDQPYALRTFLFKHVDTISYHTDIHGIRRFIFKLHSQNIPSNTNQIR